MKNKQPKIKSVKTGKEIGIMYCLGCKDGTDNFKSQEVKITNKVLIEKSNCIICWSKKIIQQQTETISLCFQIIKHGYLL